MKWTAARPGKPIGELDRRLVERGVAALRRPEDALAGSTFLVGARLTLADISLVAYRLMAPAGGFDLAAFPPGCGRGCRGSRMCWGSPSRPEPPDGSAALRSLVGLWAALALAAPAPAALAWGNAGHRMVGAVAMRALPAEVPPFLRAARAVADVGELSRELDRSKGAGRLHDSDRDPGHFLDAEDDGRILGGPLVSTPPTTRADYEKALQAVGTDSWQAGYLNYSIAEEAQQLAKDFGYWRALAAAERNPAWRKHRQWFAEDRRRRETQILATIGDLSHFVADGAQPLHVSAHYNGWGAYPNPRGYTLAKVHGPFEGEFVFRSVKPAEVAARLKPFESCGCPPERQVADYLTGTWRQVEPFYALEKAGAFQPDDPRGAAFAAERLAAGAAELRDLIVEAWRASEAAEVGWKPVKVRDVEAGRADPYPALIGAD